MHSFHRICKKKMVATIDISTIYSFEKTAKVAQQTFTILDMLEMFVHIDKMLAISACIVPVKVIFTLQTTVDLKEGIAPVRTFVA